MTDSSPPLELVTRALGRLRQLVDGNGIDPDSIQIIDKNEAIYALFALMRLEPSFEIEARAYAGPAAGKNIRTLPSYAALQEEVASLRKKFVESRDWLPLAIKELEDAPDHGWGLDGGKIPLAEKSAVLAATEGCPTCRSTRQITCMQCQGSTQVICPYCQGQRQEACPNCFGRGEDPVNPQQRCPVCQGSRVAPCRYCRATGQLPCPTCQGRGGTPCPDCQGAGSVTQEVTTKAQVDLHFRLIGDPELPSGLLRAIDRLGIVKLPKGHADIEFIKTPSAEEDPTADPANLRLKANIPYAEIKLRLNGKAMLASSFGKRGLLMGLPAFLDEALQASCHQLEQAARGAGTLDEALKTRALRDALTLHLQKRRRPEELRRIYPVGLSPKFAQKIMRLMDQALRRRTAATRSFAATMAFVVSLLLYAGLLLTPLHAQIESHISPAATGLLDVLVPSLSLFLSWFSITHATRWALQRKFPEATIKGGGVIGKIGLTSLIANLLAYAAILALSPNKPSWLLRFFA